MTLERFRGYLLFLARWHWNPRLQGKLDPSDVVQQTLAQGWAGLKNFRGQTDAEMRAWLRQILIRCLSDAARNHGRLKRSTGRERSLDEELIDRSSARLEAWLDDGQSSPQECAERNEELVQLADAVAALPEAQQEAITLHHLHGASVAEVAEMMGRSIAAVAGLLKRGLRTLRTQLKGDG